MTFPSSYFENKIIIIIILTNANFIVSLYFRICVCVCARAENVKMSGNLDCSKLFTDQSYRFSSFK